MNMLQKMCLYLILALIVPSALEAETVYATENVNIREGATTESESVGYLLKNDGITKVEACKDGWTKVFYEGEERYISSEYLTDTPPPDFDGEYESLGIFKITAYCGGSCCNGKWAGKTSTGATPEAGVTVAVAPWVIPYGSRIYIEGAGYRIAEDTGGFANRNSQQIDLYFDSHAMANRWGIQYKEVRIRKSNGREGT